ncbi:carbohydrate ABC transporter permease [Tessaracoccus massiliensis]|uniref:carbohydrate ABC transporter permease n=1 Tax=Tessaracoccus massiliensis TaxID=1522311 RepID=UPI0006943B6B|nr:sugar ABC transporter permease [Tessaracoccus massiliensis]
MLLLPLVVLFLLFFAAPIGLAAIESLTVTTSSGLGLGEATTKFAGATHYQAVLSDPGILAGFGRVLLIGLIQVPTMLILATIMALLFDSGMVKLRAFFQTSAFLPHAIPGVVSALLWSALYLPQVSPIVRGLEALSVNADFLGSNVVLFSIMNMTTWEWTGYNMIILYTALQSIPREVLESAEVDGASRIKTALQIKLPLIVPGLVVTTMFSIIGSLQQFAAPMVLRAITNSVDSRFTPNLAVYSLAAEGSQGQASALSLVIAALALVLSLGVLQLQKVRDR